jgi:hypothetical protein
MARTPDGVVLMRDGPDGRGPDGPNMPQRTFRLEQAELGALDLFLVPIGPGEYEAVFT